MGRGEEERGRGEEARGERRRRGEIETSKPTLAPPTKEGE